METNGPNSFPFSSCLSDLAIICMINEKLDEALSLLKCSLSIAEEHCEPNVACLTAILNYLGEAYWQLCVNSKAEHYWKRALVANESSVEVDHEAGL